MKKIFVIMIAALLICAMPIIAFAEGESVDVATGSTPGVDEFISENEIATDGEISADKAITETIADYLKENVEEISVIGSLLAMIFYEVRKHGKLNGSIGTLNNNAIAVAENSATTIKTALAEVADIANVVKNYKEELATLLGEVRKNAEEKESLEVTLGRVENFLKTAKLATIEMSNEVAELIALSNIPNSRKDPMFKRHTVAIEAIEKAEEVIKDDNKE